MDKKWFEYFSDRNYWEELVQTYITTGTAPGKAAFSHVADLWEYFKFCILTDNRFFFNHPLLTLIKEKLSEHVVILPANTTLFRARIDSDHTLKDQADNLTRVKILKSLKEKGLPGKEKIDEMIMQCESYSGYDAYFDQAQSGFEGFSPEGAMSPPAYKVSHGRCNLPNCPHLYVAADIHTAIAETRPYIRDSVSVASISTKQELRIVDFCFDFDDQDVLSDWFYMAMSEEFSVVNKGNENDYFATQYLTMLVKSLGYHGLRFKSSLVLDGVNYVVFDEAMCKPISSKLYTVAQTRYDVRSASIDSHLKDADGKDVTDPPVLRIGSS